MPPTAKSQQVYEGLKARIERGDLAPGTLLSEAEVVQSYAASRTPVREAIRSLQAEGLLDLVPRKGARVAPISLTGVRELFAYRTLLEAEAARLVALRAAQDATVRSVFAALLARFEQIRADTGAAHAGAADAGGQERAGQFWAVAADFDAAVTDWVPNAHLRRALVELRPHTVRLRNIAHGAPARMAVSLPDHLAMARAVVDADGDAAAAAVSAHLAGAQRAVFASLAGAGAGAGGTAGTGAQPAPETQPRSAERAGEVS